MSAERKEPASSTNKDASKEFVRVAVRCRPMNSKEKQKDYASCVVADSPGQQITVENLKSKAKKEFFYNHVYPPGSAQQNLFEETARPIIDSVLKGINGTIFAYGQTGTGKTYTMEGPDVQSEADRGIMPRAFQHIFDYIAQSTGVEFLVQASFLEVYQEEVYDLVAANPDVKLDVLKQEKGCKVEGLQNLQVKSVEELNQLLKRGRGRKRMATTDMNDRSSRSHCIFSITIESSVAGPDGSPLLRQGKLNMVDLAGSERLDKTGAGSGMGQAKEELKKQGAMINKSLLALGQVINALTDSKIVFIPYRNSKLTRLLEDSLGGNTKTVMIANIGPADYNYEETVLSLRFAERVKKITNDPKVNENPKDAKLRELKDKIEQLKKALSADGPAMLAASSNILGKAAPIPLPPAEPQIIYEDNYIDKVVVQGISQDKLDALQKQNEEKLKEITLRKEEDAKRLQAEKAEIENKNRMLQTNISKQEVLIEQEKHARIEMQKKLKEMEAQMLAGNKLLSVAEKQRIKLAESEMEIHRKKLEAEKVQLELQKKDEVHSSLAEKYETQAQEAAAKAKKFELVKAKYQSLKQEHDDLLAEQQEDRDALLTAIREVSKDLKFKDALLQHFIPKKEWAKTMDRARWDADKAEFYLQSDYSTEMQNIKRPGSAHADQSRPIAEIALKALDQDQCAIRYRHTNIIQLQKDVTHTLQLHPDIVSLPGQSTQTQTLHGDQSSRIDSMFS